MHDIILEIINQFGYIGIFLLITLENIFPPIPSELVLSFGGFMTTVSNMNVWGVIISATMGSVLGAIVLFIIGQRLTNGRLEQLIDSRLGKMLHLKKEDVNGAEQWFNKYGNIAVLFCRFVPIVRSLISIPAGITKMKFSAFLTLTLLGTFIWNMVLVHLGWLAGESWERVAFHVDVYSRIAVVFIGIFAFVCGAIFIKRRFLRHW